jgi:hypothetical protein
MASVDDYLALITSEYSDPVAQRDYIATVAAAVQPYVDMQNQLAGMNALFDLDVAVGVALDTVGQWIGLTRFIAEPLDIYFSWGVPNLGWGQGIWYSPYGPSSSVVALDDPHYRILLKARVVANQWDGTIPGAYKAWNTLFAPEGYQILIQDGRPAKVPFFTWGEAGLGWGEGEWWDAALWSPLMPDDFHVSGDMSIILGLIAPANVPEIDPVTKALFEGGYLGLVAAGVRVEFYATQSLIGKPMFAWGAGPDAPANAPPVPMGGWGIGAWPILTPGN